MTKKKAFTDIAKKAKKDVSLEEFFSKAKVQDLQVEKKDLDPGERRGPSYKNKKGEIIKLGGRNLPVPLNAYELNILTKAANKAGMPISTFIRAVALEKAKK